MEKQPPEALVEILRDSQFWQIIAILCRTVYGPLRLLRYCDQKCAAMDKLYYFVRKTDDAVKANVAKLAATAHYPIIGAMKSLIASSASEDVEESETEQEVSNMLDDFEDTTMEDPDDTNNPG